MRLLDRLRGRGDDGEPDTDDCCCRVAIDDTAGPAALTDETVLRVDATDCPGGDLAGDPACRAAVVDALAARAVDLVRVEAGGRHRFYADDAAALLSAAGRFADAVAVRDDDLAERARTDPLGVAREATGRAGPVSRTVAECGLAAAADAAAAAAATSGYDGALDPGVSPAVALGRTRPTPPADATLVDAVDLDTGARATRYDRADGSGLYHLRPPSRDFSTRERRVLRGAERALADGTVPPGSRAPARAVRRVLDGEEVRSSTDQRDVRMRPLADTLRRHTRGLGTLDHLFADPRVTDVTLAAPPTEGPVRTVVDGDRLATNVRLSAADVAALSARVRARSGRSLSRVSPTADAALDDVRVAAVAPPASDGTAFAFRLRDDDPWTLPRLVACGSVPAPVAGLLSVAVERGAAVLVAGPRGAGKTSLLGALCFAVPPATRTVLVEDTPELPAEALAAAGRDVQRLHAGNDVGDALTPTAAVRTALRLGEGALVVGEVRGEEAQALYEAMGVGAAADTVLGTIHGTGGESVRERVVSDLGVAPTAFATTDLLVTLGEDRRVASVEEVRGPERDDFAPLAARDGADAAVTPTVDRGESRVLAALAGPEETYADVRTAATARGERLRELAAADRTGVDAAAGRDDG
ncbi:ATPase, T2SS/T4P/T4SS family [Halobaculum litoreum]|uniref:ATPase, T2SS/T4P/T4SS family n=1 Tax=Halobaculum litoreum TaxID=3031998 RepID=UPI0024C41955|nr:ATPase, T2SS/T4P/T4SS family [Halobaculum sp. DT92]